MVAPEIGVQVLLSGDDSHWNSIPSPVEKPVSVIVVAPLMQNDAVPAEAVPADGVPEQAKAPTVSSAPDEVRLPQVFVTTQR